MARKGADYIGTMPVQEKHRFDENSLERFMMSNVQGFTPPVVVEQFKGGQSNPTYALSTPGARYVLRRKPFGPLLPSAHAVDREYRLIAGLYPTGFPVAKPYGLCTDDSVIGAMFYVMALADGRNLWDGTLPDYTPDQRTGIYNAMVDTLADLHNTDDVAAGLGESKDGESVAHATEDPSYAQVVKKDEIRIATSNIPQSGPSLPSVEKGAK